MSLRYHRVWVIKRIASVVTAFLGDSFALITDASAESAMLQRVSRDYVWCREQASHTIVIAHSQGASLARSVLKDRGTRQTTFVTLGAGVGVLHSLKGADLAREYRRAVPFLTVLVLIFSTILFNLFIVLPWVQRNDPAVSILRDYAACVLKGKDLSLCPTARLSDVGVSFGFVPIEVIFFMFVPLALDTYAKRYLRQLSLLRMWADRVAQLKLPAHCTRRWIDISSARDPVSLGGLLTDCCDESLSVSNSFWPILEHSTYSRNIAVLSKILALASKDVPTREAPGGEFLRLSLKNLEQQRRFALRLEVSATAVSLGLIVLLYFYIR